MNPLPLMKHNPACKRARLIGLLPVIGCMANLHGATLLSDDFESGLGQWTAGGAWGTTSARHASPIRSVSDSPGAFYANNSDTALTLAAPIDLGAAPRPALRFHHMYFLEAGYDFGRVELSLDGG